MRGKLRVLFGLTSYKLRKSIHEVLYHINKEEGYLFSSMVVFLILVLLKYCVCLEKVLILQLLLYGCSCCHLDCVAEKYVIIQFNGLFLHLARLDVTESGLAALVRLCNGDMRKALNILQV